MGKKLIVVAVLLIPLALIARLLMTVPKNRFFEVKAVPEAELFAALPSTLRIDEVRPPSTQDAWPGLLAACDNTRSLAFQSAQALDRALFQPEFLADVKTMATLEETFSRHRRTMSLAVASVQKPGAYVAEVKGGVNPALRLLGLQSLTTLLARRGTVALAKGDSAGATADLRAAFRVGRRLYGAKGPIYYATLGGSLMARVAREIRLAAARPGLTERDLRSLMAELPTSRELREDFKSSIRSELHWFIKNEVARLRGPGGHHGPNAREADRQRDIATGWRELDIIASEVLSGHPKPFDRMRTVADAWPLYQEWIEEIDRSWNDQSPIEHKIRALVEEWPKATLTGMPLGDPNVARSIDQAREKVQKSRNPYGRLATWFFLPMTEQNYATPFRARAEAEGTRLVLALRLYERKTGRLPTALSDLCTAGFLSDVPADPFGDGPFHYDPAGRKVWSVGMNGRDDGGIDDRGGQLRSKDVVFRLETASSVRVADARQVAAEVESRQAALRARTNG